VQRLNSVESGRARASEEFLAEIARQLGFRKEQVVAAYLEGRKSHLQVEQREIMEQLAVLRPPRRRSA
jgi:protein-disulfide isomerase-like protein with CxxC motif